MSAEAAPASAEGVRARSGSRPGPVAPVALAWLAMAGVDLPIHAAALSAFYAEEDPFLLSPEEAFRLIPLGYLAFALLAVLLVWLMRAAGVVGARAGAWFGLKLGLLAWGALVAALLSITPAKPALMAGWLVGQSVEMAVAGAFVGASFAGTGPWRLFASAVLLVLLGLLTTFVLQSMHLVPIPKTM